MPTLLSLWCLSSCLPPQGVCVRVHLQLTTCGGNRKVLPPRLHAPSSSRFSSCTPAPHLLLEIICTCWRRQSGGPTPDLLLRSSLFPRMYVHMCLRVYLCMLARICAYMCIGVWLAAFPCRRALEEGGAEYRDGGADSSVTCQQHMEVGKGGLLLVAACPGAREV